VIGGVSKVAESVATILNGNEFEVFDFRFKDEDLSYIDAFNENLRVVDDPMMLW
jgi:hypothetical protein